MSSTKAKQPSDSSIEKKAITVIPNSAVQEIFIDGMSSLMVGNSVSKLAFYSKLSSNENLEVVRLTVSTTMLLQICKGILAGVKNSEENIVRANSKMSQRLSTLLADVPASSGDIVMEEG